MTASASALFCPASTRPGHAGSGLQRLVPVGPGGGELASGTGPPPRFFLIRAPAEGRPSRRLLGWACRCSVTVPLTPRRSICQRTLSSSWTPAFLVTSFTRPLPPRLPQPRCSSAGKALAGRPLCAPGAAHLCRPEALPSALARLGHCRPPPSPGPFWVTLGSHRKPLPLPWLQLNPSW